jgi:hypothetical protein
MKPDSNNNCAYWQESGECENNPGYMKANCITSCCKTKPQRTSATVKPDNN